MGRFFAVNYLTPQQHAAVDACILRHRFCGVLAIRDELTESGIKLSKFGLHRYMQDMQSKDSQHTGTTDNTIVTIVERSTGTTKTLTTGATAAAIVALIGGATPQS